MDVFERDGGTTTADTVHKREEFRQIVADVHELPETQRTALLLREIDALSYDQIAEAMDTTVPSVKSLLVRARVSLAEAAEARLLTCGEVRVELGRVAEGLTRTTAPVRRHLKVCDRCRTFRGELRKTTRQLAAIYPLGPLVLLKGWLAKAGIGGAGAAASRRRRGSNRRRRRKHRHGRRRGHRRERDHRGRCRVGRRLDAGHEGRGRHGGGRDRHRRCRRGEARERAPRRATGTDRRGGAGPAPAPAAPAPAGPATKPARHAAPAPRPRPRPSRSPAEQPPAPVEQAPAEDGSGAAGAAGPGGRVDGDAPAA